MVTVKDKDCNYIEVLAMLDSASNTSFISKNVAKKLGIRGYKTHLTMNLTGGQKKSEESELIDLAVSSTLEQSVQKSIQAYAINKPCSSAKTVSRTADWLKGPEFLRKPEEEWPAFKESSPNKVEKKSSDMKCVQVTATETSDEFVQDSVGQTQAVENPIMEHLMKSCSTFRKARKVMAYVLRFISNAGTKVKNRKKHLMAKFVTCMKLRRKPLEQLMGQLPRLSVAVAFPAFCNTAINMFGPLQIRGQKKLKEGHAIIFTCMTTRAVHLQLVTDRRTDTFLKAFRQFMSFRGNPNNCWSDCGTNFIGAQHYLKEIMPERNMKIQSAISEEFSCTFHWNWNVPRASHQNGVVESLIKSVRRALEVSSKTQVLTEEQWRTFLAQVTCLVNQAPLYPSSNGFWECPLVTPKDLLIGNHFPPPVTEEQ